MSPMVSIRKMLPYLGWCVTPKSSVCQDAVKLTSLNEFDAQFYLS